MALRLYPVRVSQGILIDLRSKIGDSYVSIGFTTGCNQLNDIERRAEEFVMPDCIFDYALILAWHWNELLARQKTRILVQILFYGGDFERGDTLKVFLFLVALFVDL